MTENEIMSSRGREYVTYWPQAIARQANLSGEWIATAMERAGVLPDGTDVHGLGMRLLRKEYAEEVAQLTPAQAKAVVEIAKTIDRELREEAKTNCRGCGLPLENGTCHQCGDPI